jgi:integrase/recombinase XerD
MSKEFSQIPHIDPSSSLKTAMDFWWLYLTDQEKSEFTIKAFKGDLLLLAKFLPPDITIGSITTSDLTHFIEWLENGRGRNISCSPKSLSRRITTLKSFFRWLFDHGRINSNPAEKIVQHTVISPLPQVLTSDEVESVIEASNKIWQSEKKDARPVTLLRLLLETGIKKGECLNIKLSHIEATHGNYLFVRYADGRDRNKERKIALSDEFIEVFNEYLEQYKPEERVFPWSPRRLEYILEDISTSSGIKKHLSFSMCRWNCALDDWKKGIEKDLIRQKLGISKIQWREIKLKLQQLAETID